MEKRTFKIYSLKTALPEFMVAEVVIVSSLAMAASEGPTPAAEAVVDPGDSEEVTDDREESELEAYNHKKN